MYRTHFLSDQGCSRLASKSSIIAPVTTTESAFVQLVRDMLDSKTVTWNSVTIFYDSTVMANEDTLETMIMELQKKISVVMFDISIKPIKEILNMHDRIGKNFFVIGKQEMAKNIFELVRLSNRFFKIINWNEDYIFSTMILF